MRRILRVLCTVMFAMSVRGWAQAPWFAPPPPSAEVADDQPPEFHETKQDPIRLPSVWAPPETPASSDDATPPSSVRPYPFEFPDDETDLATLIPITDAADIGAEPQSLFRESDNPTVSNAFEFSAETEYPIRRIPSFVAPASTAHRIVRYEVPLDDRDLNQAFLERGFEGRLTEVVDKSGSKNDSISDRLRTFISPTASHKKSKKIRVVRYEVPADDIHFHAQLTELDGQILQPGALRMPEVRFFQPKARVFMDLKRSNDGEFDLFNNGAILASLDVVELYFPMPLISERFAEMFSRPGRLSSLGWRVGGTLAMGITTALNNGTTENGSAPVSTLATGIRYEFPLGRPSRELIETGDDRLDQRTRVGMEFGLQGGISTRESLRDSSDVGLYLGVLVNTPWGG
jgi:hypothetical protein